MRSIKLLVGIVTALICAQLLFAGPGLGQTDGDNGFLLLYFKEDDLYVESPTRGKKSITQTAENVTIITAREIQLMNAHTLADVLNTVPGVQIFMTGGPGSIAQASLQGSENRHAAVFLDGMPLNTLASNVADVGSLPVQNIERIEIVKGPASSAWGSALGGVINIITKSGGEDASGAVSASYGTANTGDFRAEAAGKADRLGYYVTAGRLQTDGFRPRNDFSGNNAFVKLSYDLTNSTKVQLSTDYQGFKRGEGEFQDYDLATDDRNKAMRSSLSVISSISKEITARLNLWRLHQQYDVYNYQISTASLISRDTFDDAGTGASAQFTWKHGEHNMVAGTDLDSRRLIANSLAGEEHFQRKYALYLNDTIAHGRFTVTPGVRHDRTDTNGTITSPSLGMTYKPVDVMLLRAYVAQGFSIPTLGETFGDTLFHAPNPDLKMERVTSYQAGAETTVIPFFWVKIGLFRHNVTDMLTTILLSESEGMVVNEGKATRKGLEIEIRTQPVYHTYFTAGAAFMNARDQATGETIKNFPQRTYDLGLRYDDGVLKLLAAGDYIYWNSDESYDGKYKAMIVDLHAVRTLSASPKRSVELFADVHNAFNGAQYPIVYYKNPGRWYEAGVRYLF